MIYNSANRTITTERLVLRMFTRADAEDVAKHCNNYKLYRDTLTLPYPYAIENAYIWMEHHMDNFLADKSYEFAITDKQTGCLYGAIALSNNKRHRNGELAYWVGEEYWGKGYATEAGKAMLEFAFKEKQYHKVYARHFGSNPASGRVIQKLGMVQEGVLMDHVIKENRFEDLVYYGILEPK